MIPRLDARGVWRRALAGLRQDWRAMFAAHLAWAALGIIVFTPLVALTGRLLLRLSGQPALADQDIAWFLLSPFGLLALVLMAGLAIAILCFEQATLMTIATGRAQDLHIRAFAALRYTAARAHSVFLYAVRLVVRVLLLTLPFLALAALVAWLLLTEYDINYYLSQKPRDFWVAAVLIGLLLAVMCVLLVSRLLAWSLSLPLVLFARISPARSFDESAHMTRGRRALILRALLIWAIAGLLLGSLLVGMVTTLGNLVVPAYSQELDALLIVLGGLVVLWTVGNFLVTLFTSGSLAGVLVTLHEHYRTDTGQVDLRPLAAARTEPRLRVSAVTLGIVLALSAVAALYAGHRLMDGIQISDSVNIVAHRGAAGSAPENTLASMRQAIADGADWLEIDVQESADGEVIVIHDSDFMKLAGVDLKVWDGELEEIRNIDVGSWFDPRFSAERVPTLAEVLELARGKARVVIELKYYGHDQDLEQRVIDIVEALDMVDAVAIMSLKYAAVQKVRALRPEWPVGLLSATAIGNLARLDVDFLAVATGLATPGFVRRSQEQGKQVYVWTVNDSVTMSRMMSLGVDGLITDEPALAREVMAERADLNPAERLLMHTAVLFGRPEPKRQYRDDSP